MTNHHRPDHQTISPGHHDDNSRTRDGLTPTAARTISESPIEMSKPEFLRGGSGKPNPTAQSMPCSIQVLSPKPDIQTAARTMGNLASPNDEDNPRRDGQGYSVETSMAMFRDSLENYIQGYEAIRSDSNRKDGAL